MATSVLVAEELLIEAECVGRTCSTLSALALGGTCVVAATLDMPSAF